jgi:hypothetical protein
MSPRTVETAFPLQRRDRPWTNAYVNVLSGPYAMPTAGALREAVAKLADVYPHCRLNWNLDETGKKWTADRSPESVVTEGVWDSSLTTGGVLDAMNQDPSLQPPLSLIRYPNHLGWRMSHAIGDGGIFPVILLAVMNTALTGQVADWPPRPTGRFPLLTAGLRTFARRPSMIRSAIADRYEQERTIGTVVTRPWTSSRRTICTGVSREQMSAMISWAERYAPGSTAFALLTSAVLEALRHVDLAVSRDVNILVDLRSYLGAGWVDGNFIAGVPMPIVAEVPPEQISASIRATKRSGRPLANQILTSLRAGGKAMPPATEMNVRGLPQLTFSQVINLPQAEELPFLDKDRFVYTGSVEPAGPHGVTVLFVPMFGATTISASFHDNATDPTALDRALKLVASDPVDLLASQRRLGDPSGPCWSG